MDHAFHSPLLPCPGSALPPETEQSPFGRAMSLQGTGTRHSSPSVCHPKLFGPTWAPWRPGDAAPPLLHHLGHATAIAPADLVPTPCVTGEAAVLPSLPLHHTPTSGHIDPSLLSCTTPALCIHPAHSCSHLFHVPVCTHVCASLWDHVVLLLFLLLGSCKHSEPANTHLVPPR